MGLAVSTDLPSWSRSCDRKSRCAQWRPWFHTSRPITPCSRVKTLRRRHVKFCDTEKFQSGNAWPNGTCSAPQLALGVPAMRLAGLFFSVSVGSYDHTHSESRIEMGMPQLSGRPHTPPAPV